MDKIIRSNKRIGGFTLIELLVTISLAAIILGIGVPSFTQLIESNKLHTTRDLLVSSIASSQQHAMTRNIPVYLCPTANATTCANTWAGSIGWLVYEDQNRNNDFTSGTDPIVTKELNIKIQKITSTNIQTRFSSTGNVSVNEFILCSNLINQNDDKLSINRSGRITYEVSGSYCTP